jgi:hypothetical protein
MIGFLILFLHVLVSPFKAQAQQEAEIVLLRHQLGVLRQRVPTRPKLTLVPAENIIHTEVPVR